MGSLVQRGGASYVGEDFVLSTIDIVQDPSAPGAFVNGIMEGVDWVWNKGILVAQEICEEQETEIITPSRKVYSYTEQTREFKNFLSSLKETL